MKREELEKVLELFRDGILTIGQTVDIITENTTVYPGKKRGDYDMSHCPVRALVVQQLDAKGLSMKEVSLKIGRNESYMFQFLTKHSPRRLHETDRPKLAELLGVSADQLRG
jgi:hypothetical protein